VVAVGSIAHNYSKTDAADVEFCTRTRASLVYGNAKRHLMYALSQQAKDGGVSIVHPGITQTNITAHYPKPIWLLIKWPMRVIFMSPRKAALCVLRGIFDGCGEGEWIGPRVFDVWGFPKKKRLTTAAAAERAFIEDNAEALYQAL
jgi:hypothetical protein